MQRLALDHLTLVDSTPSALAESAHRAGCPGIGLFMEPMAVLPLMPRFELYRDAAARRDLRRRMDDLGVVLDLAYPFTLSGRSDLEDFRLALECAAELGAGLLNVLCYDRDPARRLDRFGAFCDLAAGFGHRVAIEFFPASQVGSLSAALALVQAIGRPGAVGVNVDLLHLMRAGERLEELAAAPAGSILYGQLSDGPVAVPADPAYEAASDRRLAGAGGFDLAGFVRALPRDCPISVEIPRDRALAAGLPREERAAQAIASVRRALA